MIARLGTLSLFLALAVSAFGALASYRGARLRNPMLIESARTSAYSVLTLLFVANGLLLAALLRHDFSIRYVAENGSRETPTFFTVLSLWSADEGSLLLWSFILSGFVAAVAYRFRRERPGTFPLALGTMYVTQVFFLALVILAGSPFRSLAQPPANGNGPLPLLQNHPLMAAHPPMLYLGFIGFTVPFAFAIAALVKGELTDEWLRTTRRWTVAAWGFLTAGLFLGALWSYGVLGWGGYWAWDPVENVALLPWLTATAFLHSVMVQERRGMLKVWNLSLVVGTYALTVLGTFLTRGSILFSVHAFAASLIGPMYLGFLALVLVVGFGLIAWRSRLLASEGELDAVASRETAFLGNNLLLTTLAFTVLLGTIYPLVAEALTGAKISVGGPYFRQTTIPIVLMLLVLMGLGPLLPWRRAPGRLMRARLQFPLWAAGATVAVVILAGVRNLAATLAFGLAAFVIAGIVERFVDGTRLVMRSGLAPARSLARAVLGNRRLYGGLVVHVGLVIAAVAITVSSSFGTQREATLRPGEATSIRGVRLVFTGVRELTQPQRRVSVADLEVLAGATRIGVLRPSLNFYPGSSQAIGSPAFRVGVAGDLYTSLTAVDPGSATFRFFYNPGVAWIWVGGGVMVLGAVLAGWPARKRKPAPSPGAEETVPARAEAVV